MIEIYLMVSLAPIPFATFGNREQSMIGKNYLRSLFALGFQGFLIMVCVGIYAVLIQSVAFSSDIIGSLWGGSEISTPLNIPSVNCVLSVELSWRPKRFTTRSR